MVCNHSYKLNAGSVIEVTTASYSDKYPNEPNHADPCVHLNQEIPEPIVALIIY